MSIVLNYEESDIVSEKVLSYYVQEYGNNNIRLVAIVDRKIKHPEAPDVAMLPVIDSKVLIDGNKNDYPELVVFKANHESLERFLKNR